MTRYEYDCEDMNGCGALPDLMARLNARGKAGWRFVKDDEGFCLFERVLPDDVPGNDGSSGPVMLNETVTMVQEDRTH